MEAQYVIGIDLGTTNSVLAFARSGAEPPEVTVMEVPQLVNPGEVREQALLPSCLYLPGPADFAGASLTLPWGAEPGFVVGALARKRGAESAGRLVASAKSWLAHAGVDRTAALLPERAPEGVRKLSPVEASRRYLEHLRGAWDYRMTGAPFAEQRVLVTVPASFDATARELTLQAAEQAGYGEVTLLEEPQAAFYAWIERHPDWRERVNAGDLILVVDIGGGTTDFTLIEVTEKGGELALERIAVGDHILLGGDNMDLALARTIEGELAAKGARIDALQLQALWHNCRDAKEKLLDAQSNLRHAPVTILGKGTGLVGGAIKASLTSEHIERVIREGFFPPAGRAEGPQRQRRSAVQEIGLPYASDAAITRHLAGFLNSSRPGGALPARVLFNGGVLRAELIRERLTGVLNGWAAEAAASPVETLGGEDLMHAVARGAVYYGLARDGKGVRIRGGIPRTYYVGVETSLPAVPGMPAPLKFLTVAPFGMEEGSDVKIPNREFGLIVGEPAEFRLFSSTVRRNDDAGSMLDEVSPDLQELSPMDVSLDAEGGGVTPVSFETAVTETGMLQLWCVARDGRRWKLEFNVREKVKA